MARCVIGTHSPRVRLVAAQVLYGYCSFARPSRATGDVIGDFMKRRLHEGRRKKGGAGAGKLYLAVTPSRR